MKAFLRKILFLLLLTSPLVTIEVSAQDLTGIWRGYFKTDLGDTYKLELQIKQSPNGFKGVTYSYLTTVFYGKATLTGSFNKEGQSALIREIKTVELKMSPGSVSCIMKYLLDYSKSGKEEFLEGVYTSAYESNGYGTKKGDNCGGGIVRLRKVPTSDFYIEPFLRNKPVTPTPKPKSNTNTTNTPAKTNLTPEPKKTTTPKTTTPPKTTATPNKTTTNKVVNTAPKKPVTTPVRPDDTTFKSPVITKNPVKVNMSKPAVLTSRQNELMKALVVNSPEVIVKLYDNGEIDGDTISVYLNNKLVLSQKMLTAAPLTIKLHMDESDPEQELVMVAENLGRIPPNTSLMIVEAGEQRFDVRITSTEQKNAVVRFRYEKR